MHENDIAKHVVEAALQVHKALGPGLFESVYEAALHYELTLRGLRCERQKAIPAQYRTIEFEAAYRADLIVESLVIVEIKSVEALADIQKKQLLTYLRLSKLRLGLLLNFNSSLMRDGMVRMVNHL